MQRSERAAKRIASERALEEDRRRLRRAVRYELVKRDLEIPKITAAGLAASGKATKLQRGRATEPTFRRRIEERTAYETVHDDRHSTSSDVARCKDRPSDNRRKHHGGGSRPFIPWCDRRVKR